MLKRFSSRRASLYEEFLKRQLAGAERYDRKAGYFPSSPPEFANWSFVLKKGLSNSLGSCEVLYV